MVARAAAVLSPSTPTTVSPLALARDYIVGTVYIPGF
jgi:hypothetical protein